MRQGKRATEKACTRERGRLKNGLLFLTGKLKPVERISIAEDGFSGNVPRKNWQNMPPDQQLRMLLLKPEGMMGIL